MKKSFSIIVFVLLAGAMALAGDGAPAALLNSGHVDEAIRVLKTQVASNPNNAEAFGQLCRAYHSYEDFDSAISSCQRAIQLDPNNAQYHLWLGRAYGEKADEVGPFSALGYAKKVAAEFERAVQLAPRSIEARNDLVEFYTSAPGFAGGGDDKAVKIANETVAIDPAAAANMRAQFALKDKDYRTAEREELEAIRTSGDAAHYWLELARIYSKQKHWAEFERTITKAQSAPKHRPQDTFNAADLLVSSGRNLDGAIDLLRSYLAGPTDESAPAFRAHFLMGRAYEKLRDKANAAKAYRASLELASGFRPAKEALKRVGG